MEVTQDDEWDTQSQQGAAKRQLSPAAAVNRHWTKQWNMYWEREMDEKCYDL